MTRETIEKNRDMHITTRRLLEASILALCLTVPGPIPAVARTSPVPSAPTAITATSLLREFFAAFGIVITWPPTTDALQPLVASGGQVSRASGPRPLPPNLKPSLKNATSIKPRSYSDGCHRMKGQTTVKTCIYGATSGARSVVLFGDSHAAMWLPALDSIAARRGWKLYSMTKSACPVAKVAHNLSWAENYGAFGAFDGANHELHHTGGRITFNYDHRSRDITLV